MKYHKYTAGEKFLVILPMLAALATGVFRIMMSLGMLPWEISLGTLPVLLLCDVVLLCILLFWCLILGSMVLRPGGKALMTATALLSALLCCGCFFLRLLRPEFVPAHIAAAAPCVPVIYLFFYSILVLAGAVPGSSLWPELIARSTLPIRVTDTEGEIVFDSRHAMPLSAAQKKAILSNRGRGNSVPEKEFTTITVPVKNGFLLEQKDMRDYRTLLTELDSLQEQLKLDREVLLRKEDAPTEMILQKKKPDIYLSYIEPVASLLDGAAEILGKLSDAEPIPARRMMARARLLISCAEGYASLYENRGDEMSLAYFAGVLESPVRLAGTADLKVTLRSIARGTCSFRAMCALYRVLSELILEAGEQHWSELSIRMRNDGNTLRCLCSSSGSEYDALLSSARGYAEIFIASYGKIGIGTEDGKNTLYFTVFDRSDSREPISPAEQEDIRSLLNMPERGTETTIKLLEKEVEAICNTTSTSP